MAHPSQSEITQILAQLRADDIDHRRAVDRVFGLVYDELHRLASGLMRRERIDHTLQPTALVHEAYIRLVDSSRVEWQSRAHFFGIAARAMRQILVDHARRRSAEKREGGWERVGLDGALELAVAPDIDLLLLDDSLTRLAEMDARVARVAELRVFARMTIKEIAHVLGVTSRTIDNDWSVAKMWLSNELRRGSPLS